MTSETVKAWSGTMDDRETVKEDSALVAEATKVGLLNLACAWEGLNPAMVDANTKFSDANPFGHLSARFGRPELI